MRPIVGIIGYNESLCDRKTYDFAVELGNALVTEGYRIVSGGKGGVMEAVCMGAMNSAGYFEGSIICIIPENDKSFANKYCDISIPTGIGEARNIVLINTADILIAIGGGAGTLSEIAFAWKKGKQIIAVKGFGGWSDKLANSKIDDRKQKPIIKATNIDEIISYLKNFN